MKNPPKPTRYWQADIERAPDFLLIGQGPLDESLKDWVQPLDRWTLCLYDCKGVVQVNVHSIAYEPGTIVLFPPGCHGRHLHIGDDTMRHFATFRLPGRHGVRHALPMSWEASSEMRHAFSEAARAVSRSSEHGFAYVWFQLWHVAKPLSVFRAHGELYDAEAWILANLSRRFRIEELADAVGSSTRTLLRLFQLEHGMTIAQFVRDRRVREATRLLTETGLSIKAIAAKVGVPDPHQFNKLVRYATGLAPSEYRRMTS